MVYRGPYKVRVEEKDIPRIEHPNDAIVRVRSRRSAARTCTCTTA
jgi:threonine dehydrogenase-like Zn-dependent dehydrogenase